jgi:hypothetical protein
LKLFKEGTLKGNTAQQVRVVQVPVKEKLPEEVQAETSGPDDGSRRLKTRCML